MPSRKVSLNEFVGAPAEEPVKPRRVSLCFIGKIEVLKPLTPETLTAPRPRKALTDRDPAVGYNFMRSLQAMYSWLQRPIAVGGALAMVALILLSAIFVGIYDQQAESEVSWVDSNDGPISRLIDPFGRQPATEKPSTFDISNPQLALIELPKARSIARSRSARHRTQLAAYRARRKPPRPLHVVTEFVPTTLIIYPENGEIKTRIEPQLIAIHKRPLTN